MKNRKRNLIVAAIALICIAVGMLCACTPSAEEYYADLRAQAEKANADLGQVFDKFDAATYATQFDVVYTYYNDVQRGSTTQAGWGKTDDSQWRVQSARVQVIVQRDNDSADVYTEVTGYQELSEKEYKSKFKKGELTTVATAKRWTTATDTVTQTTGDAAIKVGGYDLTDLLTIWQNMIGRCRDVSSAYDAVTDATNGFKIYQNFCQIGFRYVYDTDGNPYANYHDPVASKGVGSDLTYDWEKVGGMRLERVSVTSSTAHDLRTLEYFSENVIAYYDQKNEIDKSLVLKADVWAKMQMVVEIETKNVPQIPQIA